MHQFSSASASFGYISDVLINTINDVDSCFEFIQSRT